MKTKAIITVISGLVLGSITTQAAQYAIFNANSGPATETLWANVDGSLMDGTGFVAIGYFGAGVVVTDIPSLLANVANFTATQTHTPGNSNAATIFSGPGYVAQDYSLFALNTGSNPLIGRSVYAIASNAANLLGATDSNGFSMFLVDTIKDDGATDNQYTANPRDATPIIGELGTFTGDPAGQGSGTYTTLKLVTVPEPSAALLGALGALGLLRRRRN
jgi:MYXO-CTERM domain-containing protein